MRCLHPIEVPSCKGSKLYIQVPCGRCYACRKRRQNDWSLRIDFENSYTLKHGGSSFFVTLTYSDEFLDYNVDSGSPEVNKRTLQLFFKRLRKYISFRYFCCAEYGDSLNRPHYHGIFFTDENISSELFEHYVNLCWSLGFIQVSEFTMARASYCAKYVNKYNPKDFVGVTLPFALMSRRPAIGACMRNEEFQTLMRNTPSLTCRDSSGSIHYLPRYYSQKFFSSDERKLHSDSLIREMDMLESFSKYKYLSSHANSSERDYYMYKLNYERNLEEQMYSCKYLFNRLKK